ncbi:MAG: hypothetical protein IPP33_18980 [Flavobacteriales bacterium]|nr:hypothetical protein [Flavobacteriales bacterium]
MAKETTPVGHAAQFADGLDELLKSNGTDPSAVTEMKKDVDRLEVITPCALLCFTCGHDFPHVRRST